MKTLECSVCGLKINADDDNLEEIRIFCMRCKRNTQFIYKQSSPETGEGYAGDL